MQQIFADLPPLFAVLSPFTALPVFLIVTQNLDQASARRLACRAILTAGVVLVLAIAGGQLLLGMLGISIASFQLAGSAILFLFSLKLIFGTVTPAEKVSSPKATSVGNDAAYPLAIPTIAGPGSLLTVVLLTDNDRFSVHHQIQTVAAVCIVLTFTLATLFWAPYVVRTVGIAGINIASRIVGLVLASAAVNNLIQAGRALHLIAAI